MFSDASLSKITKAGLILTNKHKKYVKPFTTYRGNDQE